MNMEKPEMEHIKILLIEDNPAHARLIKEMLAEAKSVSFDLEWKDTLFTGLDRLAKGGIDVILWILCCPTVKVALTLLPRRRLKPRKYRS